MDIITRAEWGARPPRYRTAISLPSRELWLHHSVSATGGASRIRGIQKYHMDSKGWPDIAYTFLINALGEIYEGVPPGFRGTHTAGHNTSGHAICLLGNFNTTQPTPAALDSLVRLIGHGHDQGWWPDQLTGGHRDTRGGDVDDCPGNILYALIPTINEEASMPTAEEIARAVMLHPTLTPGVNVQLALTRTERGVNTLLLRPADDLDEAIIAAQILDAFGDNQARLIADKLIEILAD